VNKLLWFLSTSEGMATLSPMLRPLLVCLIVYQADYLLLLARFFFDKVRAKKESMPTSCPPAVLVLPTLLRTEDELEGLERAIASVLANGYPGALTVLASIDGAGQYPDLVARLTEWARPLPHVHVIANPTRVGKAVAIDRAARWLEERTGEYPPIFFNMDADSVLAPNALAYMAARLQRPSRLTGEKPMIVASNVAVSRDHYWRGWRHFFTVGGQIALSVAREYTTSIAVGKHNKKLFPVTGVSGALYCTWSALHLEGPRWASFMRTLRFRDWLLWWLGEPPPRFADHHQHLPEAMTGPGDDTWVTWLACAAWWKNGAICFELPRTPLHALWRMLRAYIARPVAYDPRAVVYTTTPTRIRALWTQRVRWNASFVQDCLRWYPAFAYHWSVGAPVLLNTGVLVFTNALLVGSLIVYPFVQLKGNVAGVFAIVFFSHVFIRGYSTALAIFLEGDFKGQWRKLLSLPVSSIFHTVFNIATTVVGFVKDFFLLGAHTSFSPEQTLIRGRFGRIALLYRVRRALALACRSVIHGDVPLGWFWLGWHETAWTYSGFAGWDQKKRAPALKPRSEQVADAQEVQLRHHGDVVHE
jgi:hypothetical protein